MERIIGSPYNMSKRDLLNMAIYFGMPIEQLEAVIIEKIKVVSNDEFRIILNDERSQYLTEEISLVRHGNYYIKNQAIQSDNKYTLVSIAKIIAIEVFSDNRDIYSAYKRYVEGLGSIRVRTERINDILREIRDQNENLSFYKFFDWKLFKSVFIKRKCKIRELDDRIIISFPKLKLGNDIEGYINYKKIHLEWSKISNEPIRMVAEFAKFTLASDWCEFCLHPHISGNVICYGNRLSDSELYINSGRIEFFADLIYETVHSYYPENPYISVKDLGKQLKRLEMVLKNTKSVKFLSDEEKSRIWYVEMQRQAQYCPRCNEPLTPEGHCTGESCRGNPLAIIQCSECGQQLIWDAVFRSFVCPGHYACRACGNTYPNVDHCVNVNCQNNPNYVRLCPHCGGEADTQNGAVRCHTINCVNNYDEGGYDVSREEITTPPPCRICGEDCIQNRHSPSTNRLLYHNWFCDDSEELGGMRSPQYDRFGIPVNINTIPLINTTELPTLMPEVVSILTPIPTPTTSEVCIACGGELIFSLLGVYVCANSNCRIYAESQLDEEEVLIHRYSCTECGRPLEFNADADQRNWYCDNGACALYTNSQRHADGTLIEQ